MLNERAATPEAEREGGVLYRVLRQKQNVPGPTGGVLPKDRFDFSLDRAQQCTAIEGMDAYERKYPERGMPFGLPALAKAEHDALARWIEAGAPAAPTAPLPPAYEQRVAHWEAFLNADSLKAQLASRYIFEHWFIAHLYFDDLPARIRPLLRSIHHSHRRGHRHSPAVRLPRCRPLLPLLRVSETCSPIPYALALNAPPRLLKAWFIDAPSLSARPRLARGASTPFAAFRSSRSRRAPADAESRSSPDGLSGPVCRAGGRVHHDPSG